MYKTEVPAEMSSVSFGVTLPLSSEEAVERVKGALKDQGFGVLTEIDIRDTMKQKLDVDFRPYTILGACNPPLAHRALSSDLEVGLLLPCNVVVYETEGGSRVEILDPVAALGVISNESLAPVAREAHDRLKRVAQALQQTS